MSFLAFQGGLREACGQTGSFFDEFGAGLKAAAMGQAFTAVADDPSAAYYNPAGLTRIGGIFENTCGYIYAKPNVKATFLDRALPDIDGQPSSRGLFAGIASNLDFEKTIRVAPWFRRFAFGLVFWTNLPEINQYHAGPVASRPHFLRHDMRFQLLSLAVSLGFEVAPWLSVGVGMIPTIDSVAEQDSFAAINSREDVVKGLRLSIHQVAKVMTVPVCGILLALPIDGLREKVTLGVSYRGENKTHHGKGILNQTIGTENEAGEPEPGAIPYPLHFTINLVSFAPEQATVGLAFRPTDSLTFSYDMTWKRWSRYQTYLEETPSPPFDDTYTHRFGVEYRFRPRIPYRFFEALEAVSVRAGYYHEPSPVGTGQGTDNIFDPDQEVYSGGVSVTVLGRRITHGLELFCQYHHLHDSIRQAYIDPLLAYENKTRASGYSPVALGGNVWSIGAAYSMRF
jgi:long-subunit fatty acid transport protein